jgi:hypothetical protein
MKKTNYIACRVPLNADYNVGASKKFLQATVFARKDLIWSLESGCSSGIMPTVHTAQIV